VVSRLAVQAALRGGRLVEVATPGLKLDRVLRAVWRASGPLDPAAGDFLRVVVGRH
jgi:DNA-binding transcriptional LysR family regulator